MIRPFTCICMLMAAGSGLYLYQTKHRAQLLDRTIAQTYKQIDQTKDRIGVLKGEWALLNEPERLADLAQQHLALKTLAPTQFVALADLGSRLPAPLSPGTMALPTEETAQPVAPVGASLAPTAAVPVAAAKPAPAPARTFASNDKAPERTPEKAPEKPPEKLAEKLAEKPVERVTAPAPATAAAAPTRAPAHPPTVIASARPAPGPLPPPVPAPHIMAPVMNVSAQDVPHPLAPGTVGEAVARANHNRGAAPIVMPASSTTEPSYTQPSYAQPSYVSALGGAGRTTLPAPVPYGAAQATR